MDLYQLLEIDRKFLKPADYRGMHIAHSIWHEMGKPIDTTGLSEVLRRTIQRIHAKVDPEARYPKRLLKAYADLGRGKWAPRTSQDVVSQTPGGGCAKCWNSPYGSLHGRRLIKNDKGLLTFCDCSMPNLSSLS